MEGSKEKKITGGIQTNPACVCVLVEWVRWDRLRAGWLFAWQKMFRSTRLNVLTQREREGWRRRKRVSRLLGGLCTDVKEDVNERELFHCFRRRTEFKYSSLFTCLRHLLPESRLSSLFLRESYNDQRMSFSFLLSSVSGHSRQRRTRGNLVNDSLLIT